MNMKISPIGKTPDDNDFIEDVFNKLGVYIPSLCKAISQQIQTDCQEDACDMEKVLDDIKSLKSAIEMMMDSCILKVSQSDYFNEKQ